MIGTSRFSSTLTEARGDHGTIRYAGRRTILGGPGEIKKGTLMTMLTDLGITLDDLRG